MTTMMRWDPFQDLRSAQDEMAQMSPMLAHALGLHARQQGNDPDPEQRRRWTSPSARTPTWSPSSCPASKSRTSTSPRRMAF